MFKSILSLSIMMPIKHIFHLCRPILFILLLLPFSSRAESDAIKDNKLIVLFHGLCNKAASFKKIQKELEEKFPSVSIVALTSVEGIQSLNLSIKDQATACFEELKEKVGDVTNKCVLLIGHSQGGNRAYTFLKQYENLLNVKGLITLATPWEGAPGARVDRKMLAKHLTNDVLTDLRTLSTELGCPATQLEEKLMLEITKNQGICMFPGAKDLIVGSDFLCATQKMLANEELPILFIGAEQNDFGALLSNNVNKYSFQALNNMYSFFIVGDGHVNTSHDMQVPLYSQHALNIAPNKKNFKKVFVKGVFHSPYILGIRVPKGKAMLSNDSVLDQIIEFTKTAFGKE
ncbi:esterase/lipase family protein [Cardinium endosymbiont of Culicoides punctatus]|uniref:esterase/lipase family protein n=1 Tax=Cardinium endosymbiont of Culicoides punctatus TaxID=2304601 RepID=UPI001058FDCA|nr:hypothetical protein [Cardinium endosymbiont of Culicoides punctatus]TDG93265.1 hypothetical protein CCPUN_09200 [Cardinium endosymbiont of Culicoides punctatus]